MLKSMKTSYVVAFLLALGVVGWVFSGDLTQAKKHYGLGGEKSDGTPEHSEAKALKSEQKADDDEAAALISVRVRRIQAEDRLREISIFGKTDIVRDADVTAETTGRVVELSAKKGQWLEKGDVILRLAVDDRKSKLREAEARVEYERIGFEAAKKLSRKGFQSEVKLAQEKSEWETAKSDLAAVRLDLARTVIQAPINVYLETLPLGVGDYLKSGDTVVTMVNPNPMRVVVNVSERDVEFLKPGDTATARTTSGRAFEGKVKYIAQRAEDTTRTFRTDVWLENRNRDLRDGQTMEVILRAGKEKAHRVSPAVLTLSDGGVVGVKFVDDDSRVRFQPVRIIAHTKEGIWLSGLPDVANIIIVGQEFVIDGQKVRSVNEAEIAAEKVAGK